MFRQSDDAQKCSKIRQYKTTDIVRRLGVISPRRIHLKNYPVDNPIAVFNPAITIKNDVIRIYPRIIVGYFMYVSAVAKLEAHLEDITGGSINITHFPSEIVLSPSLKYDIWGIEDPRLSIIDNKECMVYTGRTINYFNPVIRHERTLPIMAVNMGEKNHDKWTKTVVFVLSPELRKHIISDKDAFLFKTGGKFYLFHRPHMDDEKYYLVISEFAEDLFETRKDDTLREIEVKNTEVVLEPADFEIKLGWATPPVEVEPNKYVALIHGIGKPMEAYRVFAVMLKQSGESVKLIAVTPYYIMEPKTSYEVFGDRPYTIFPCGSCKVDDKLIICYGAADYVVGFGELDLSELLSILDKGKLE